MKTLRWFGKEYPIALTYVQISQIDRIGLHNWFMSEIETRNWFWLGTDDPTIVFKYEEDKVKFILKWL